MKLLIEFYKSSNIQRNSEFISCIHENIGNKSIDRIYVFITGEHRLHFISDKIEIIRRDTRPTFKDFFDFCNQNLRGEKCMIACTDIMFDETLGVLDDFDYGRVFVALTRWEIVSGGKEPFESATSQDVWAFVPPIPTRYDMDFNIGMRGCDNRIAKIMYELGYEIRNPGKQVVATHLHLSGHHPSGSLERVPGPYLCLMPNNDINKKTDYIFVDRL